VTNYDDFAKGLIRYMSSVEIMQRTIQGKKCLGPSEST
jgi:hypothetical protein